jgi:predicted RNase H-like HicB family nuclease
MFRGARFIAAAWQARLRRHLGALGASPVTERPADGSRVLPMQERLLRVDVEREDGVYWAQVHEWPGCFATGDTLTELLAALEEAIAMYVTHDGEEEQKLAIRLSGLELRVGSERELRPARAELDGFANAPFRSRDPHGRGPTMGGGSRR